MSNVSELSGFNSIIGAKETAENFIEMTVKQIDNSVFRDMWMNTMEAHLTDPTETEGLFEDPALFEGATDMGIEAMAMGPEIGTLESDFHSVEEGGCPNCGKTAEACECGNDPTCEKTLNTLPATDPKDAATFFSMTNKVSAGDVVSPKAECAIKEQLDYINAVIPDTVIEGSSGDPYQQKDDPRDKVGDMKEDGKKGTLTEAEESMFDPEFADIDTLVL